MTATSVTDKFFELKNRLTAKVGAGGVASTSATTIPHTFVGLTNGNAYIVTVNRTDSAGTTKNPVASTEAFVGVVSGTNFINCVRAVEGTAQAWAADTVLEILVTAYGQNKLIEGIETEHNKDGTHKKITSLDNNTPIEQKNAAGTSKYLIGRDSSNDTHIYDVNNNKNKTFSSVASAVNYIKETNAATGNGPTMEATGSDTNIDLQLKGKGTGKVKVDSRYGTITANSDGATITFDMAVSNLHSVTLGGNRTLAVSNVSVGQAFILRLLQDGTGSRTVTWFSTIKWAGGSAPTLTTTASKADTFGFICTSSGNFDGFIVGQNL